MPSTTTSTQSPTTNTTKPAPARQTFHYPSASSPVYRISDNVDNGDIRDELDARLAHLSAMLITTYGASGDLFRDFSPTIQENFLWACHRMATECQELALQLSYRGDL